MNKKSTTLYNTRHWLNSLETPSTGSVVCYHGIQEYPDEKEPYENMFLEISDCHVKARLHNTIHESKLDFINKLKDLRGSITNFIIHLENKSDVNTIHSYNSNETLKEGEMIVCEHDINYLLNGIGNVRHFSGETHHDFIIVN